MLVGWFAATLGVVRVGLVWVIDVVVWLYGFLRGMGVRGGFYSLLFGIVIVVVSVILLWYCVGCGFSCFWCY